MSSYIVEDKTINRILGFLDHDRDHKGDVRRALAKEFGVDFLTPSDANDATLGALMYAMNVRAVGERYEDSHDLLPETPYRYHFETCTQIQALKSLRCWLYQCSEGDVPACPLYTIFTEYSDRLAYQIVSESEPYARAEWA